MRNMNLSRPIIFFDIESTGVMPQTDRIIELAAIKVDVDGTETVKTWLLNPGVPIPAETTELHGITDEIVKDCPSFAESADDIFDFFNGCDLAGFNSLRFDAPILQEEFSRAGYNFNPDKCRHVDVMKIYHKMEPRDLSAAVKFYCGKTHSGAHGAEADARATLEVFKAQLERYPSLPRTVEEIEDMVSPRDPLNFDRAGMFRWTNGELCINFGRKKGTPLKSALRDDPQFLRWIAKGNFPQEIREVCKKALETKHIPNPPKSIAKRFADAKTATQCAPAKENTND
jgi:DNA polymerase-3 subunit epsilon